MSETRKLIWRRTCVTSTRSLSRLVSGSQSLVKLAKKVTVIGQNCESRQIHGDWLNLREFLRLRHREILLLLFMFKCVACVTVVFVLLKLMCFLIAACRETEDLQDLLAPL